MRRLGLHFLLLAMVIECSAQTPPDPRYEGTLGSATYSGGYVLDWDSPAYTRVSIYGPETKLTYSKNLQNAKDVYCNVWAVDSNGNAARACERREGQIELLDRAGELVQTIGTGSYFAQHIAFAPDHTFWTIGYELNYESRGEDFDVVHHYRRNGEEISRSLPWSQIAGDYNAYTSLPLTLGGKKIYTANDRIGFWTVLQEGHGSWVEISPAGTLLGKYDLGRFRVREYCPVTMTAGGSVYAKIFKESRFSGWAVLDRSKGQWREVKGYPKGTIIGSDGESLVFSEQKGPWTVLHTVSSGSLRVEPVSKEAVVAVLRE